MGVYDQAARYTAKLDPQGFLAWLIPGVGTSLEYVGWLDTRTLPFPGEPDRTCDTVAHLREPANGDGGLSWAVPVEFQTEPDSRILERLLEYALRLRRELRPHASGRRQYDVAGAVLSLTGSARPNEWCCRLPSPSKAALIWTVEHTDNG